MIGDQHRLTPGYVRRHVPPRSRLDVEIAVLDIAQDFLLAHLAEQGVFDLVVFKGGTALRKLFAGPQGRFSTDMDLAVRDAEADRDELAALIAATARVALGPFAFEPEEQRGRWHIRVTSPLGNPAPRIRLDVGPPCWLAPEDRPFVPHPTQPQYGFALPTLPCMRLEEILAEKVARLTRTSTARDASDLVWAATTTPHSQFARDLVRRLAALKVWVDNHGMRPAWSQALHPAPFRPDAWLAARGDRWDDEQIGLLASPPPAVARLEADLRRLYGWLRDLTDDERPWAEADPRAREYAVAAIRGLPHAALSDVGIR